MPHQPQADGRIHGVIVGLRRASDGRYLMIRRGRNVCLAPLKIAFPGGGIEPQEAPADAAVRETREEVGLEVAVDVPIWDWLSPYRPLRLIGYAARWSNDVVEVKHALDEVEETMWLSTAEIRAAVRADEALPGSELFADALDAFYARD